jgi:DNA-binding MarR family transcriptional regulator
MAAVAVESVLRELLALHQTVAARLRAVGVRWELIDTDVRVMLFLSDHPAATVKAVRDAALVTSGTATVMVDRLQRAGLVAREPNPADRRSSLVTLLPAGHAVVADVRRALAPAGGADTAALLDALQHVRSALTAEDA